MTADGNLPLTQLQPRSPRAVKRLVQSHAAALGFTRRNPIIRAELQTPPWYPVSPIDPYSRDTSICLSP